MCESITTHLRRLYYISWYTDCDCPSEYIQYENACCSSTPFTANLYSHYQSPRTFHIHFLIVNPINVIQNNRDVVPLHILKLRLSDHQRDLRLHPVWLSGSARSVFAFASGLDLHYDTGIIRPPWNLTTNRYTLHSERPASAGWILCTTHLWLMQLLLLSTSDICIFILAFFIRCTH